MLPTFSLRSAVAAACAALIIFAAACSTPARRAVATLPTLTYGGSQEAVQNLDRQIAASANDPAQLAALCQRMIATLRDPATSPAGRQAVAQRLGIFPEKLLLNGGNALVFVGMLADEQQIENARLALERVPGPTIDALFVRALETSTPATRLALIQSVGNRRLAAAVEFVAPVLKDANPMLASAAARALGQIATREALEALDRAAAPNSTPVIEAKLEIAHRLGGREASQLFNGIIETAGAPVHLRAAALLGLVNVEPAAAPERIARALTSADPVVKPVILESLAAHPAPEIVPVLTEQLATFEPVTQAAVISALARRGDARAVPAILTATKHGDPVVRSAAISALGELPGNADVAQALARLIATGETEEAKLARQSLARLNGPGVADTVLQGAKAGDGALRVVYLDQLAARYVLSTVPLLEETRRDNDVAVRSAAVGALGEIAPFSELPVVIDWAVGATEPAEQSRALRAVAGIVLRNPDVSARTQLLLERIRQAEDATALRLLPVLPRIGGGACAIAAGELALRDNESLATAAAATLARWPDSSGLLPLIDVAEKSVRDAVRAAAVDGAVRFLERTRDLPSASFTNAISRLFPAARTEASRLRLVYLLGRSSDDAALALARKLQSEPPLAFEATQTVLVIVANRSGRATARASDNTNSSANVLDRKPSTVWNTSAAAGKWIEIDLKVSRPIRQLTLEQTGRPGNYPEHVEVFVTDNPKSLGEARASVPGAQTRTVVDLPKGTRGRYVVIRNTAERVNGSWTISELYVD